MFERMLALRNDVGLLSEEYDPRLKRLVGNFPQAFTHVGLVNSAYNLDRRENRAGRCNALNTTTMAGSGRIGVVACLVDDESPQPARSRGNHRYRPGPKYKGDAKLRRDMVGAIWGA